MSTRNTQLLVYECENMKFTCNFSIKTLVYEYSKFSTSRLRVREYEVYMQLLHQNILSTLLVYECENMKFTCNFSIIYTYRLRVRESKHSLYISRLRVQKDSIIRRFNHL